MMTEDQHDLVDFINQEIDKWDDERRYVRVLEIALAALTQPASPALKLPETISVRTAIAALDNASAVTTIAQSYKMAWNSCIAETERLNAPRTAPIEPICATGGADWVKVPREPTQKMIDAHMEGMATGGAMKAYRQMLAAAPEEK